MTLLPPSPNAVDRSVTIEQPEDVGPRIQIRPDPATDPILICTVDPRSASTLLRALKRYRRYPGDADEANRADAWIGALERAVHIYWDWIEERERRAGASERVTSRPSEAGASGDQTNEGDRRSAAE